MKDRDIIDNFSRLTLGRYIEILTISKDEDLEDIDKQVAILSILSGIPEDEILHLPIGEYKNLVIASKFLEGDDMTKALISKRYYVGGFELVPTMDYKKIETCQYIDFQTFAQDYNNRMVELLSVMLVPSGHRYNEGYDIIEVQRAIREQMSVTDAVSLSAFFLRMFRDSIKDFLNYSIQEVEKIKDKEKRKEMMEKMENLKTLFSQSGDGSQT